MVTTLLIIWRSFTLNGEEKVIIVAISYIQILFDYPLHYFNSSNKIVNNSSVMIMDEVYFWMWNKSRYSINYPLIIRQCRLNYPLIKNGLLNAAFSFNFLPFCNKNLVPCYYCQGCYLLCGIYKCTSGLDNHSPWADEQRHRASWSVKSSRGWIFHWFLFARKHNWNLYLRR